jgi:hypothetical protein
MRCHDCGKPLGPRRDLREGEVALCEDCEAVRDDEDTDLATERAAHAETRAERDAAHDAMDALEVDRDVERDRADDLRARLEQAEAERDSLRALLAYCAPWLKRTP